MQCFIFIEISNNFMNIASLKYLKSQGIKVILFCKNILIYNNEITRFCDDVMEINTHQISSLISACNFVAKKEKIIGIMTLNDQFLVHTAELKEYLGFQTTTSKNIENLINRFKMRTQLKKINANLNPKFNYARNFNESVLFATEIAYPFIIRPIARNKFIYSKRINNLNELKDFFNNDYAKTIYQSWEYYVPGVLLEEEIIGDEYSVHFLKTCDGKIILSGVFKKESIILKDRSFINITTQFPANYKETDYLFQTLSPIIPKIGFNLGLLQIDCILSGNNIKVIDINPTINSNIINYFMIRKSTGIDFSKINIDIHLKNEIDWHPSYLKGVVLYNNVKDFSEEFMSCNLFEKINENNYEIFQINNATYDDYNHERDSGASIMVVSNSRETSLELVKNLTSYQKIMQKVS